MARYPLILVSLSPEQIVKAKEINGKRKQITHALLCGPYGQMFGTEKQCLKYWSVWRPEYRIEISPGQYKAMFPNLFDKSVITNNYEISDFESTFNLVNKLIAAEDATKTKKPRLENRNTDKQGCLGLILIVLIVLILILTLN